MMVRVRRDPPSHGRHNPRTVPVGRKKTQFESCFWISRSEVSPSPAVYGMEPTESELPPVLTGLSLKGVETPYRDVFRPKPRAEARGYARTSLPSADTSIQKRIACFITSTPTK
jgi:hypothetical protein